MNSNRHASNFFKSIVERYSGANNLLPEYSVLVNYSAHSANVRYGKHQTEISDINP